MTEASPSSETEEKKGIEEVIEEEMVGDIKEDNLTYDLRELTAFDITPVMTKKDIEIHAQKNTQLLIHHIIKDCKHTMTDVGRVAILPPPSFRLPREKRIPAEKKKTRWEKFAEERGIRKKKRSRLVWCDVTKDWVPRWGYKSGKKIAEKAEWCIELKDNEAPDTDPFAQRSIEKQLVKKKQKLREVRNRLEATGGILPKGLAPNMNESSKARHRGKDVLKEAMRRAELSSASVGRFDKLARDEVRVGGPVRKKVSNLIKPEDEKASSLKLLGRLEKNISDKIDKNKMANWSQEDAEKRRGKMKKGKGVIKKGKGKKRR